MAEPMRVTEGIPGAFDRAYVINAAGATQRWADVSAEFARIGVAPVRVEAVWGKDLSAEERAAATTPACSHFCTPATIGCASSHIKVWRQILADGVAAGLDCEDDPQFVDNFRELLIEYAREFPPDFDIIYLGCLGCATDENVLTRAAMTLIGATHPSRDVSPHIWVPPVALTTHAFIVSAKGARKLLAAIEGRITTHIDKMINKLMGEGVITAYAVRPLLAHQDVSLAATSISTAKTPRGPSMLLDKARFSPEVTWGYAFGAPFGRVGRFTVNLWAPTFLAGGTVLGLLQAQVAWPLAFCILLLLMDILPMVRGDRDTLVAVIVNVALTMLGWVAGWGIRAGISSLCTKYGGNGGGKGRNLKS